MEAFTGDDGRLAAALVERVAAADDEALRAFAAEVDAADALAPLRKEFCFPVVDSEPEVRRGATHPLYFTGNSLGLRPVRTAAVVGAELDKWAREGVEGHFRGEMPWVTIDETVRDAAARLVGAEPVEVVTMNSLTVNLHLLMTSFYRPPPAAAVFPAGAGAGAAPPAGARFKILMEDHAFPSDAYAVKSQLALHGYTPEQALVLVGPRAGRETIDEEDVLAAIAQHRPNLALVMLAGVQYYSGQLFDIPRITAAAHAAGAIAGWDLAHAVGNVPLRLHEWDVDFAAWCSYKYLNSGPGGIAGAFLHSRFAYQSAEERPRLAGWWGHRKEDRFAMGPDFHPLPGVAGFQLSNPPVLQVATLRASLSVFDEAGGMAALRAKSLVLTGLLEAALRRVMGPQVEVLTPGEPSRRGAQLSLAFPPDAPVRAVQRVLAREGVIVDVREPRVMRVAPAPLYNNASDVIEFVLVLRRAVEEVRAAAAEAAAAGAGAAAGAAAEPAASS